MITIRDTVDEKIVVASVCNEVLSLSKRMWQIARELEDEDEYRVVRNIANLACASLAEESEILREVEDKIPANPQYIQPMLIVDTIYEDWFDVLSVCLNQLKSCVIDLLTVYASMLRRGEMEMAEVLFASSERIDGWASEIEVIVVGLTTV